MSGDALISGEAMSGKLLVKWDGDVLGRKRFGDFFYRFLVDRFEAARRNANAGALCVALDGDWGVGKSFFIEKWAQDIRNCGHPVVIFDAWRNDLSKEPLLGFIAAMQDALKQWSNQVSIAESVRVHANAAANKVFRRAGRAVLPVAGFVAKGVLKKVSGIAVDELMGMLRDDDVDVPVNAPDGGNADAQVVSEIKDNAIDEFFRLSIEEHSTRIQAIEKLKAAVSELLAYLEQNAKAKLPMFVLIDELDRCRPSYAIELLEGVKHLFDVNGLCFCVSTNLDQLGESVKGVYGGGFDARRYLKRFFAIEYVLPEPEDFSFASLLVQHSATKERRDVVTGLKQEGGRGQGARRDEGVAEAFHLISRAFGLDLRSQRQVFDVAEAAAAGVEDGKPLHILFLFALAALRHVDRDAFEKVRGHRVTRDHLRDLIAAKVSSVHTYRYRRFVRYPNDFHAQHQEAQITVGELLKLYLDLSEKDLKDIRDQSYSGKSHEYPNSIERIVAEEMPAQFMPAEPYVPSIRNYPSLVSLAGQVIRT